MVEAPGDCAGVSDVGDLGSALFLRKAASPRTLFVVTFTALEARSVLVRRSERAMFGFVPGPATLSSSSMPPSPSACSISRSPLRKGLGATRFGVAKCILSWPSLPRETTRAEE